MSSIYLFIFFQFVHLFFTYDGFTPVKSIALRSILSRRPSRERTLVYLENEAQGSEGAEGRRGKGRGTKVGTVRCVIMPYLADLINPCA